MKNKIDLDYEIMEACDYFSNEWIYGDSTMGELASMIVDHLKREKDIKVTKKRVLKVLNEDWR